MLSIMSGISDLKSLGHQLDLDPVKLNELQQGGGSPEQYAEELLVLWQEKDGDPSWEKLARALKRMGEEETARRIEDEHALHHSEDDVVPEDGPPSVAEAQAEKQRLQGNFKHLISTTWKMLKEEQVDVSQLRNTISILPDTIKDEHEKFLLDHNPQLCNARNLDEIIFLLNFYMDYLNYSLLEHIIAKHGNAALKQKMEQYVAELQVFRKRTPLHVFWKIQQKRYNEVPPDLKPLVSKHQSVPPPQGVRDVVVGRPNVQTSFGFVLQSNTLRPGCMICRLVPDSPAEKCKQLYINDELLAVNERDVSRMDHDDIVALIKASGTSMRLTVQQPQDNAVPPHLLADLDKHSQRLLDEAMEKGHVNSRMVVCLFTGVAGSGKSHFKHLILGLPPPEIRQSTPLAESAIRVISISRATVTGAPTDTTMKWRRVTLEKLKRMIGRAIKAGVPVSIARQPVPQMPQASESATFSRDEMLSPEASAHRFSSPIQLDSTPEPPVGEPIGDTSNDVSNISQLLSFKEEFVDLISRSSGSRELFEVDWVYLIDSGGQRQFTEILPAFVHNASAVIFVMKLNQLLSERPMIEYYGKDGQRCGPAYPSLLTNEQFLMHNFRAIQSRQCVSDEENSASVFIAGTHRDLEDTCSETRAQKDAKLISMLRPVLGTNLAFHRLTLPEQLIFPVNAKAPTDEDHKIADVFRREIMKLTNETSVKIPLPWFVFEQFVRELAATKEVSILSKGECQQIAQGLLMSKEECDAALGYLVKLNLILYYREWLPNVVFCESQVLLDKISELVEFSHCLRGNPDDKQVHPLAVHGGKWVNFRDHGIITIDSLKEFPKHYIEGIFTPQDLLKILIGHNVTAPITKLKYIMPCLLPELSLDEIDAHRQLDNPSAAPLLVKYKDGWVPAGCFTILISYLQNSANWKLLLRNNIPSCLYRNCTTFRLPTLHRGQVTLIDSFEYLEIHIQVSQTKSLKVCSCVRNDIFNGLEKAAEILRYGKMEPEMAFFCSPRDDACKPELHLACIADSEWTCTVNPSDVGGELSDRHTVWLDSVLPALHLEPTDSQLMNEVAVKAHTKWREVGCELGLSAEELLAIGEGQPRPLRCFSEVFTSWKTQKTAPYTWETIIKALRAPQVNQIRLAETLMNKYAMTGV